MVVVVVVVVVVVPQFPGGPWFPSSTTRNRTVTLNTDQV